MNIKFYVKETGEDVKNQDDFMLNAEGIVWEEDYNDKLVYATYIQNDLIGWRVEMLDKEPQVPEVQNEYVKYWLLKSNELQSKIKAYKREARDNWHTIEKLSAELSYILGIVERGSNIKLEQDMRVSDVVLTYVKNLENRIAYLESKIE